MDHMQAIRAFARVVETGVLPVPRTRCRCPTPTVSKQIRNSKGT